MDRRSQQKHIRAAREWLGRAEDSLAQENDVQGDLKLMLAKAELAHVGQCPRSLKLAILLRRILALLVAIGLAAVIVWEPTASEPEVELPLNPAPEVNSPMTAVQDVPISESQPEPPQNNAVTETPVESPPQAFEAAPAAQEDHVVEKPDSPIMEKKTLPDAAKQQLMESAGKILRQ